MRNFSFVLLWCSVNGKPVLDLLKQLKHSEINNRHVYLLRLLIITCDSQKFLALNGLHSQIGQKMMLYVTQLTESAKSMGLIFLY